MADDFAAELRGIEEEWQDAWREERLFEVDPGADDKFFITVAYPYPSGGMHIGHVRTFALPDVFARFKRMQGYNVLFPMAWHVTGTPIIGALERLKEGEEEQLHVLRDVYNVPEEDLESFEEPMDFAEYFIEHSYRSNMEKLGFSIDWRREFTTNDPRYNRFIEWQYKRLKEQGLVEKGLHPTKYCLNDENPVTTHDLLEGESAEKQEYTLVKFSSGERIFPMATLRPETVYGVTHALVAPDGDYVQASVDGEEWVVSADAAEKLAHQAHEVDIHDEFAGRELVGERLTNPVTGDEVLLLPATFVDPASGSGVVMSVPAHAPYDWISLQDLQAEADGIEAEYDVDADEIRGIEPVSIIDVEGYGEFPAQEACEAHGVTSQDDEDALEEATEEVYEAEFHRGEMNVKTGIAGTPVADAREAVTGESDGFDAMYDFSEEVVCRCGGTVIVSEQESWFLTYDDPAWKDRVNRCLNEMRLIPDNIREQFDHTVDWLESWPAIRNYGLGTKMPFDEEFVIEPLSDSTIYMAFYTIRHLLDDVDPENLDPVFFDHVFRGEGSADDVADATGIDIDTIEAARESFDYWYPLDWRTTADELIENHLTFMLYHHTALFHEDDWPQGIATWGLGTLEGEKMSSSKGHVVLPDEALQTYGADTVRLFLFASSEPWQDFDWRAEDVSEYRNKLRTFYNRSLELHGSGTDRDMTTIDRYARSRLQRLVQEATTGLEEFQTRKAGMRAFFELNRLINHYRNRADTLHADVIDELVETQVKLMAPFTPHLCEELWRELGNDGFVAEAAWPEPDEDRIDPEVEAREELLRRAADDINEIAGMVDAFSQVRIIVADDWKRALAARIDGLMDDGVTDVGEAMDEVMQEERFREHGSQVQELVQHYLENPGELPDHRLKTGVAAATFTDAAGYLADRFDADITVEQEAESGHGKASQARPGRPALVLE